MSERTILLDSISPQEFCGANNSHIDRIAKKFPALKIAARGSKLPIAGDDEQIDAFVNRFEKLTEYYSKYRHISPEVIDQVFDTPALRQAARTPGASIEKERVREDGIIVCGNNGNIIQARTPSQQKLVGLYEKNDLLFAVGPAGSGKTYTAIALAVRELKDNRVKRIILTRPAVEAGEKLGFLPGDMKEKLDPYLQPLYDALGDMIPQKKLVQFMEEGIVQIAPLAYMRGRTLDNAFVILDEAQNTSVSQMKMFLTRMGKNAKFIVTGDITQIDLPLKSHSGLRPVMDMLRKTNGIGIVEFDHNDIVRHELVKHIVLAFDRHAAAQADDRTTEPEEL